MEKNLVSIIVPCFKQAEFLTECIDSVLKQSHRNWECIIVNDGSPDNTDEIAQEILKLDKRISYIRQENKGLAGARNAGVHKSKGEFILTLDADDMIFPNYLEYAVKVFSEKLEVMIVCGKTKFFGTINSIHEIDKLSYDDFLIDNQLHCSAVYRRSFFDRSGGYDTNAMSAFADWDFWISGIRDEKEVHISKDPLFLYRRKEVSMITEATNTEEKRVSALFSMVKKYPKVYTDLLLRRRYSSLPYTPTVEIIKYLLFRFKMRIKSIIKI